VRDSNQAAGGREQAARRTRASATGVMNAADPVNAAGHTHMTGMNATGAP